MLNLNPIAECAPPARALALVGIAIKEQLVTFAAVPPVGLLTGFAAAEPNGSTTASMLCPRIKVTRRE